MTLYQSPPAGTPKKLYATISNLDPLFELDPSAKDRMDKSTKDLRLAKLITSMDRFGTKRLEFSGKPIGDKSLVLTQTDGKWMIQPDKTAVSNEKVQSLLDKLSGNRIKDFLTGSAIPAGESEGLTLTLGDDKDVKKRQILFWKNGNQLYGRDLLTARKEAFTVDTIVQSELPWDRNYFKPEAAPAAQKSTKK